MTAPRKTTYTRIFWLPASIGVALPRTFLYLFQADYGFGDGYVVFFGDFTSSVVVKPRLDSSWLTVSASQAPSTPSRTPVTVARLALHILHM